MHVFGFLDTCTQYENTQKNDSWLPELVASATQKSWRELGSDAKAMEEVTARNAKK